jgi:hypothetical protein
MITGISKFNEGRHQSGLRGLDQVPLGSVFKPGRFGRMFPDLPPLPQEVASEAMLIELGEAMVEATSFGDGGDNSRAPAGYTYLGQFIDHDLTFDTTTLAEQVRDPQAVFNFRTPQLELDNLYGTGPRGMPHLFERGNRAKFAIGTTSATPGGGDGNIPTSLPHDLPRMAGSGFAVIGDPRNDENLAVAQTHLAFLKFHNAIVEQEGATFEEARRLVRWHYQWIVLHDFLKQRILDAGTVDDVLTNGRRFFRFEDVGDGEPFIPVEFAVAAYRLGHSMVREGYDYNRVFRPGGVTVATLALLFQFSGRSGDGTHVPIPSDWIIDWRRFYDVGTLPEGTSLGFTRKLNPLLAPALQKVPGLGGGGAPGSLAAANLLRGLQRGLPSGQAVAKAMSLPVLQPGDFNETGHPDEIIRQHGLETATPLWYYVLKEAEIAGGEQLGPVGARIVAEVFVGLLEGDSESFLRQDPSWVPTLGTAGAAFTMADLLAYVGELNPIGDDPA